MNSKGDTLLEKILSDFEKCVDPESEKLQGEKAWEMILQYRIEQLGCSNSSNQIKEKIIAETTTIALSWDTDDAALSTTQKIFNRLASGRYSEAVKLAESSIQTTEAVSKSALSKNAKKSINTRHSKTKKVLEEALEYYEENREMYKGYGGKKKAAYDLSDMFPPLTTTTYRQHLKKYK